MLQSQVTGFSTDIHRPSAIEQFFNTFLATDTPPPLPLPPQPPPCLHNFPFLLYQGAPSPSAERKRQKRTILQYFSAICVLAFLTGYHDFTGLLSSSLVMLEAMPIAEREMEMTESLCRELDMQTEHSQKYVGLVHRDTKVTCQERNHCIITSQSNCNFPKE